MELHECTAQEAGSVASPGLALDQFYPLTHGTTPVSYGAAPARPQAFGFGSAGVGCPTKDGWSEAPTKVREFWRHEAHGRGLLP